MNKKRSLAVGLLLVLSWAIPSYGEWFNDNFSEWRISNVVGKRQLHDKLYLLLTLLIAICVLDTMEGGVVINTVARMAMPGSRVSQPSGSRIGGRQLNLEFELSVLALRYSAETI
jgi:hypothetical protein